MKFSTIAIFAFVFTVDVWATIHDLQHFFSRTDEQGQPSTPKRRTMTKVNLGIDIFLLVIMIGYLITEFNKLGG